MAFYASRCGRCRAVGANRRASRYKSQRNCQRMTVQPRVTRQRQQVISEKRAFVITKPHGSQSECRILAISSRNALRIGKKAAAARIAMSNAIAPK